MKSSKGSSLRYIYPYYNTVFCWGCRAGKKRSQSLGKENVKSVGKNTFQVQHLLDAKMGGKVGSNASEKYIQVTEQCVQLVHCNELTMIIKKTVQLPSVHNNGTLRNNNSDPKILHAVQNWWPCPSSDSSIISYSPTSKVPDQANLFLERKDTSWQYDSFSIQNAWCLISKELRLYQLWTLYLASVRVQQNFL